MTTEEIFGKLSAHMVEGMMKHEQLADYYDFLDLSGFRCCHKYHYISETLGRAKIHNFYIEHYNRILMDSFVNSESLIPAAWLKASRFDVDPATKKAAIKTGFSEWHKWEKLTRDMYAEMHKELIGLNENTAAEMVEWLLAEAEKEMRQAEKMILYFNSIGYDLAAVYSMQAEIREKYSKKIHCMETEWEG